MRVSPATDTAAPLHGGLERFRANPGKVPGKVPGAPFGPAAPGRSQVLAEFLPKPVTHQVTNTLWGKAVQTFMEGTENVSQSALQTRKKQGHALKLKMCVFS